MIISNSRYIDSIQIGEKGGLEMLTINPTALTGKEIYKFFIGSVIPRPVAFITSRSKDNVINGAPFSFFNIVSSDPPILSIAIQRKDGAMKDTARNIKQQKEFVIHICDEENIKKINETAASFPSDQSEILEVGFNLINSEKIMVPGIKEAKIRIECKLEQLIEINNDEEQTTCDLVLGRAVCFHIEDDLYHDGKIDPHKLKPVSRLAGNDYSKIGEIFSLERPQ